MYLHYSIDIDTWECDIKYYKYPSYEWKLQEAYPSNPRTITNITCFGKEANTILVF